MIKSCRVCGNNLFNEPIISYYNMPKGAQFFPDWETVCNETGVDLTVMQCQGCGLVQLANEPVPYYKEVIRASAFSEEMKKFRIKQFQEFVVDYSLIGKKILEVGCGFGEYLSIMQECGVDSFGLEYCEESVNFCTRNGLKVMSGFIDSPDIKYFDINFNAFFILNFLEHIPDPNSLLRGIYNNLIEGGIGLIEVPNFDMILRNNLFSEFTRDHLLYFTKESLSLVLSVNGFDIIECKEIWHNYIISAIVRKRGKLDVSSFNSYQEKINNEINEFIDCYKSDRVAIWGAGHQALALLSLIDLRGKIKYVLDSARFKQNKFTPASHLPIVSPDVLYEDSIEAIIVMAASYSDEVAAYIREKFKSIDVAILRDYGLEKIN